MTLASFPGPRWRGPGNKAKLTCDKMNNTCTCAPHACEGSPESRITNADIMFNLPHVHHSRNSTSQGLHTPVRVSAYLLELSHERLQLKDLRGEEHGF